MLDAIKEGDPQAADQLLPLVYSELRQLAHARMAQEKPGQTLQPTALVHEAWLKLGEGSRFENRAHFFAAAAEAMRRILIDRARRKLTVRHGGGQQNLDVDEFEIAAPMESEDTLLAVHEALASFEKEDPQKAALVKLRFFAGLTLAEAGAVLGYCDRTAKRHWVYAKAWLTDAMRNGDAKAGAAERTCAREQQSPALE
jgi:RNA polymerase sigma factor (TIGR02999 family)